MAMSKSPTDSLIKGFQSRVNQLHLWKNNIVRRKDWKKNQLPKSIATDFLCAWIELLTSTAEFKLNEFMRELERIDIENLTLWLDIHSLSLFQADKFLAQADKNWMPILLARSRSDCQYDEFINSLLTELNLKKYRAISVHQMEQHSHLSLADLTVKTRDISNLLNGIQLQKLTKNYTFNLLGFFPSIRSLNTLALLYHEFGHAVWSHLLEPGIRSRLIIDLDRAFALGNPTSQLPRTTAARLQQRLRNSAKKALTKNQYETHWPTIGGLVDDYINPRTDNAHTSRVRSEIAADAFAGLTGGYAYCTTLCSFLLSKRDRWTNPHMDYQAAPVRAWIAIEAAKLAGTTESNLASNISGAFDTLAVRYTGQLDKVDKQAAMSFLGELKEELIRLKIPLADKPAKFTQEILEKGQNAPRLSKRKLLTIAAQYRDFSLMDKHYVNWERKVLKNLGIWQTNTV